MLIKKLFKKAFFYVLFNKKKQGTLTRFSFRENGVCPTVFYKDWQALYLLATSWPSNNLVGALPQTPKKILQKFMKYNIGYFTSQRPMLCRGHKKNKRDKPSCDYSNTSPVFGSTFGFQIRVSVHDFDFKYSFMTTVPLSQSTRNQSNLFIRQYFNNSE